MTESSKWKHRRTVESLSLPTGVTPDVITNESVCMLLWFWTKMVLLFPLTETFSRCITCSQ